MNVMQTAVMRRHKKTLTQGFTIVELLIVIVVIAIIAAITIIAYNNIQNRAQFSKSQSDLKTIVKALAMYKEEHGAYPITDDLPGCVYDWCGWDQATGDSFIPGLSPEYISVTPQMPSSLPNANTYLYQGRGADYQLIRYNSAGITDVEKASPLRAVGQGYDDVAWGYKTNTGDWW